MVTIVNHLICPLDHWIVICCWQLVLSRFARVVCWALATMVRASWCWPDVYRLLPALHAARARVPATPPEHVQMNVRVQ